MNFKGLNGIFLLLGMLILNACFSMTPEYQQPDLGFGAPENYQHVELKNKSTTPVQVDDRWWEAFGDPKLNQLVEDVLRNNWDIRQAAARRI
jgi:outer membrane protein TolC